MDKPSFKLVGAPCGHHGQYTFYKALRLTGQSEKIIAIGDFFFVRVWQDSELVSIGELQLLWTDRVSDQTLVSLRLYFLPENTPEGRNLHGEDEVLAINDKVVLRADDLLSWMTVGSAWRWGLRAVWRGACAPPADPRHTAPLHQSRLDFSDIDTEKNAIVVDTEAPGVVVFSYPRYCRYRALLSRLEGIQADWLRDSLVAALGGYSAPTNNTRILYCKDTFEYPELEGHEFVCNHLAPKLKGRPRGRRRRADAPRSDRSATDSPPAHHAHSTPMTPRRLSLRNGAEKHSDDEDSSREYTPQDKAFMHQLQQFYRSRNEQFHGSYTLKDLSLRSLYSWVISRGGYEAVCRHKLWRVLASDQPARARRHYERYLLPFENHERRNCTPYKINGKIDSEPIATIDVTDSPLREDEDTPKILRTPSPDKYANLDKKYDHTKLDFNRPSKFDLDKPYRIEQVPENMTKFEPSKFDASKFDPSKFDHSKFDPSKFDTSVDCETGEIKDELVVKNAEELNREFLESLPKEENKVKISVKPVEKLIEPNVAKFLDGVKVKDDVDLSIKGVQKLGEPVPLNGHTLPPTTDLGSSRPARSSLRHVRVKPARHPPAGTPPTPLRPDSASSSSPPGAPAAPPSLPPPPPITNFGIHHPPPPSQHNSDDEIVEVPYKPKTPEIIDLDEYPESPQAVKKKKLEILKEGGLEVTPLPAQWPAIPPMINPPIMLNPAMQHQIMTQAQLFQMYNIIPQNYANGIQPPKVIQASSAFGTAGPEKTVYGNPKDPFMPPPHVLHGAPVKPLRLIVPPTQTPTDLLDLTCITKAESPSQKPAVEIVRLPTSPSPKLTAQNLTKNYTLVDGKAVVGSNLEITLVNKAQSPVKHKPPQKRSSNGKFMSAKTPTPPKEQPFIKYPSPSHSSVQKKPAINIPNYQLKEDNPTQLPTPSPQNAFKNQNLPQIMDLQKVGGPMASFMDPYMALYSSLAGSMDQRQLAMYRDLMANQFRSYPGLLNLGISNTPTTKN